VAARRRGVGKMHLTAKCLGSGQIQPLEFDSSGMHSGVSPNALVTGQREGLIAKGKDGVLVRWLQAPAFFSLSNGTKLFITKNLIQKM